MPSSAFDVVRYFFYVWQYPPKATYMSTVGPRMAFRRSTTSLQCPLHSEFIVTITTETFMSLGQQIFALRRPGRNTLHAFALERLVLRIVLPKKITIRATTPAVLLQRAVVSCLQVKAYCSMFTVFVLLTSLQDSDPLLFQRRLFPQKHMRVPWWFAPEHGVSQTWGAPKKRHTHIRSVREDMANVTWGLAKMGLLHEELLEARCGG